MLSAEPRTDVLALRALEAQTLIRHAIRAFPDEACGLLLEHGTRRWVHPAQNVQGVLHAQDPTRFAPATQAFTLDPVSLMAIRALQRAGGRVLAIYHSHPNGLAALSREDHRRALSRLGMPLYPSADQVVIALGGDLRQPVIVAARWDAAGHAYRPVGVEVRENLQME